MAKSLEEHLYRSAQTKEEYLDSKTLEQRLQTIAQGLDLHRAPGTIQVGNSNPGPFNSTDLSRAKGENQGNSWGRSTPGQGLTMQQQIQQQQQVHGNTMVQMQGNLTGSNIIDPWEGSTNGDQSMPTATTQLRGQSLGDRNQNVGWGNAPAVDMNNNAPIQGDDPMGDHGSWSQSAGGMEDRGEQNQLVVSGQDNNEMGDAGSIINPGYPNTPKFQDPKAAQKQKVVLQQQQRLLLLRHASKCKNGPNCPAKFCSQMVTLWKHMKTCRDRNCKTPHCLSSRCVLNHYRICKSQCKTATCEVCGPVMAKIKQNDKEDERGDPLVQGSQQQQAGDTNIASMAARMMANQAAAAAMQPEMQAQFPNQIPTIDIGQTNFMGDMAPVGIRGTQVSMGNNQSLDPSTVASGEIGISGQTEQSQLHLLQLNQIKMQQQLEALKHLQGQQQHLLDQQGRLKEQEQLLSDMHSPQAQQLRQQQLLLDQLQKRCQQHQLRLQQEIETQTPGETVHETQGQGPSVSRLLMLTQQVEPIPLNRSSAATPNPSVSSMDDSGSKKKRRAGVSESRRSGKALQSGGDKGKALRPPAKPVETEASSNETALIEVVPLAEEEHDAMLRDLDPDQLNQHRALKPEGPKSSVLMKSEAFAKKKALVQLNPKERAEENESTKEDHAPLPGEAASLISFMSRGMIMRHLESLNKRIRLSSRTVTHKCMPVAQALIDDQFGWVFHDPVDPVALGLPDYFEVVKNPMHLALVKKKLESAVYADMELFARDVRLVFENAILYNGESSEVGELAQVMIQKFDKLFRELVQGW